MALTVPPQVSVHLPGAAYAWRSAEFCSAPVLSTSTARLSAASVEFQHWSLALDGAAPQWFRLLCAHVDAVTYPPATLVLMPGDYHTAVRWTDGVQDRIESAGRLVVAAGR